ncbi:hypothetical protein Fmac_021393 [Flemingia macrophylla]|uniref:Uncharacterized protein n=1 Tax=Flemingia macrophylla TaxID=520843 RepID=A0ABD1LWW8_9FABA
MTGRNDRVLASTIHILAQCLRQDRTNRVVDHATNGPSWLEHFQCHSPPKFKVGMTPMLS